MKNTEPIPEDLKYEIEIDLGHNRTPDLTDRLLQGHEAGL